MSIIGNGIMIGGGSSHTPEWNDVNFIDYDGTLLYSYTADEFQALTAMPANPTHSGLTSEGWNWSLADAKAQVTEMGKCDIGQMLITDDGVMSVLVDIDESIQNDFYVGFDGYYGGTLEIDFGDGTIENFTFSSMGSVYKHVYSSVGQYLIRISPIGNAQVGSYTEGSNASQVVNSGNGGGGYNSMICNSARTGNTSSASQNYLCSSSIQQIRLGNNTFFNDTTSGTSGALSNCSGLISINIPKESRLGSSYCFQNCLSLRSLTYPLNTETSYPKTVGLQSFYYCSSLQSVSLSKMITSISTSAFQYCTSLHHIVLPYTVTSIGKYAFQNCKSLRYVTLPSNLTSIGTYAFQNCSNLHYINLPSGITTIPSNCFYNTGLRSIEIPASVTSIAASAFFNTPQLQSVKFLSSTPPTLQSSSIFGTAQSSTRRHPVIFYVPSGSLSDYTSATNYPAENTSESSTMACTYVEY